MSTHVIFDVDVRDPDGYPAFMPGVKPALEAAGGRFPARGGALEVYQGNWAPRRIVRLQFPSVAAWQDLCNGDAYPGLKSVREVCNSARRVSVEGLE